MGVQRYRVRFALGGHFRGQDYESSSEEEEEEKSRRRKERKKRPRYVGDSHGTEESSVTLGSESESNAQEPNGSTSDVFWSTDEEGPRSPDIEPLLGSSEDEARNMDTETDIIYVFTLPTRPVRPETM